MAAKVTLPPMSFTLGDASFGLQITDLSIELAINTSTLPVNEQFDLPGATEPATIVLPAGKYFRLTLGTAAAPVSVTAHVAPVHVALTGVFQFEQITKGAGPTAQKIVRIA